MRLRRIFLVNILILTSVCISVKAQLTSEDEKFIVEYMTNNNIPGLSVTIVNNSSVTYSNGFGVCASFSENKVTENTLFQAASISKSVTAALYLRNVQNGKISLDSPINNYLESWKLKPYKKDTIISTVRQLLSHNGGTNISGFLGYNMSRKNIPDLNMILKGNRYTYFFEPKIKVKYKPNTIHSYSGGGYCILQKAICESNKEDFNTQMQNEVFSLCGMNNSFFSSKLTKSQEQMISIGHKKNGKPIKDNYHVYPQLAAAGLWTTSNDLAKFLIQIQKSINPDSTGAFLSQESIRELLTIPVLNDGTAPSYGLGFGLGLKRDSTETRVTAIGHSGSNWGYTCNMWASVDAKQAVVIMCNRNSARLWPITKRILERIGETKN